MAEHLSVKKRNRQSIAHNRRNRAAKSKIRTTTKLFDSAEPANKETSYRTLSSLLDRAATKRVIHPNKAARTKSRLAKRMKKVTVTTQG